MGFAGPSSASAEGKTQVFFLDVGQGDSELIRIPGESGYFNVLLDTGEYEYAEGLIQYLQELGIERIDLLIESHPHTDHMAVWPGLYSALKSEVSICPYCRRSKRPPQRRMKSCWMQ